MPKTLKQPRSDLDQIHEKFGLEIPSEILKQRAEARLRQVQMNCCIGLIAAMPQESKAVLKLADNQERLPEGQFSAIKCILSGQSCVLVTSGWGPRRANEAARYLVEQFQPVALVSFGIAGAVEAELDIGEVVLPEAYGRWDGTRVTGLNPLAHWPAEAYDAVSNTLARQGKRVFIGSAITATGATLTIEQLVGIQHPVLEMETAGIALVVEERSIPFFSLRAISDGPRAPIPLDLGEIMDTDGNLKAGKLIEAVLRNPLLLFQGQHVMRNTQVAADNAALALAAALKVVEWSSKPKAGF